MSFKDKIYFASSNEDGATEVAALRDVTGRVVCLTGSGTRPLDLLMTEACEVVALDLNPAQNALLALKIAAFRTLSHAEFLAYLGLTDGDRAALHTRVAAALDPDMRAYWARQSRLIRRGVWYGGLWEKVLRLGAFGNRLIRKGHIWRLFAARDPAEQQAIWDRHFDDWIWRASIRLLGRRWVWTRVIGEPGGAFLASPDAVEARLAGAFRDAAGRFLFRESDFASLILRGRHATDALPLHLRAENFERVRDRLDRVRIVHGGLTDLPDLGLGPVEGFSLSDFGSYTGPDAYSACWDGVRAVAAPGAVFVERVFMNPLPAPVEVDAAWSAALTRADRAIVYAVRAGRLRHAVTQTDRDASVKDSAPRDRVLA